MYRAFATRKKRQLNHVFDAISFFYPNYPYVVQETKKEKKANDEGDDKAPQNPEDEARGDDFSSIG